MNARIETTVRVAADTEYVSHIIDPLPQYPDYAGTIAADLVSGDFTIQFTWGYQTVPEIHTAIAQLREALGRLDIDVDMAMDRQAAAILPAELASVGKLVDAVAEWTRPPA